MAMRRDDGEVSVRMVRTLRSTTAEVYAAWTEREWFACWLTDDSDAVKALTMDVRKGGRFRLHGLHGDGNPFSFTGTYLELIEGRRISFLWEYDGPNRAMRCGPSVITADLRPITRGLTELSVKHRLVENWERGTRKKTASRTELKRKADAHLPGCADVINQLPILRRP